MARAHNELVRRLVGPRPLALGRLAPRGHRMTTARGSAFTTAMGVIDRVHGDAPIVGALAAPDGATGLTVIDVGVIGVRHRAYRGKACTVYDALLARVQTKDGHALIAAHELRIGASRAGDLAALAGLQLDIVNDGADRHGRKRHRISRLHVNRLAGHDLVARLTTLRRDDVVQLAVLILDQRNERRAIGIVFDALHRAHDVQLAALEVDDAIRPLVAAANEAGGDAAVIVASAGLGEALRQTLDGLALIQARPIDDDQLTGAWGYGVEFLQCHCSVLATLRDPSRRRSNDRPRASRPPS